MTSDEQVRQDLAVCQLLHSAEDHLLISATVLPFGTMDEPLSPLGPWSPWREWEMDGDGNPATEMCEGSMIQNGPTSWACILMCCWNEWGVGQAV